MCVVGCCPGDVIGIGALQGQIGIADRVDALITPFGIGKLSPQAIADVAHSQNPRRVQNDVQHVARGAGVIAGNSRPGSVIETVFLRREGRNVFTKPRFVAGARLKPQILELRAMLGVEPFDGQRSNVAVFRKDPGRGGLEFEYQAEKENYPELQGFGTENLLKEQRSLRTRQVSAAHKANHKSAEDTTVRMTKQPA